jgi:hypothetical protein
MMMRKKIILALPLLLLPLLLVNAQTSDPRGVLIYADDETLLKVSDGAGNTLEVYLGMIVPAGSTVATGATTAEIQLEPTGSLLKVAAETTMTVDTLQKGTTGSNNITVKKGKIRGVIARLTGQSDNYNFYSRNTVCGIRGTDFLLNAEDLLAVADGTVDFTKSATGEVLEVTSGQMVRGTSDVFTQTSLSANDITRLFTDVQFVGIDPAVVPGHETEAVPEEETERVSSSPETGADALTGGGDTTEGESPEAEPGNDPLMNLLGGVLAMEVGSLSIDGITYSKVLFQPTFQVGKLEASLYLPIIYDQNLFDPDDWYKPEGNYEWSFGTDQSDTLDIINDAFGDLFLKIRYLRWGEQRDSFYFAFGNYNRVRLGHGIIMNNYENNSEFPSIRKVGLNMGSYGEKMDFELVGEDFSQPLHQVIGTRVAYAIAGPLSLGLSAAADLDPVRNLDPDDYSSYVDRDPMILNFAVDLELPLVETSLLTLLLYTDAATMLPLLEGDPQTDFFLDDDNFPQNYGTAVGLLGNILILDFKLEYQYADGIFQHGYYNSTYDKMRSSLIMEIMDYLDDPYDEDSQQGVYGSAGFTLAQIFYFSGGYKMLWDEEGIADFENDYLELVLSLKPDVIPIVGIYGSLGYSRTGFADAMYEGDFSFIDDQTTFMGEVVYPVSDYIDVAMIMASVLERDSDGNIVYDSNDQAQANYSFSLDMRLHY